MATTVTYEGNTIATVENTTKTLQTKGTWLTDDITLTDTSAGGGGGWVRPADFPDLSAMDISGGDIIYMTYRADERFGFCDFKVRCTGQYTVSIGTINGSTFVAESTYNFNSNTDCRKHFGTENGTHKVIKVTGTNITQFLNNTGGALTEYDGGYYAMASMQGQLEIYGNLPHCTYIQGRTVYGVQCIELQNLVITGACNMMFENCWELQKVVANTWDMSGCTHLGTAFRYCRNLTEIVGIDGWDVSSVANVEGMFWGCEKLQNLDISRWNVSSITAFNNMFNGCFSLETLDLSTWNTASATGMGAMFRDCRKLKVLKLPAQFVKSSVTTADNMLVNTMVEELNVSMWDTSSVTSVNNMFGTMRAIKELDISAWDLSSVTTYTQMFALCMGITTVTIPASLDAIGAQFFNQANLIKEFHFLRATPPTLQNTNAFNNTSYMNAIGGRKIYVPYSADHSILNAYQTATNWSTYASYMVEESA